MKLQELKSKYPNSKVLQAPLQQCPKCKGEGEFTNKLKQQRVCICVCLSADDHIRLTVVESFIKTIKELGNSFKK